MGFNVSNATCVTYDFGAGDGFNTIARVKAKHAKAQELDSGGTGDNTLGGAVAFQFHQLELGYYKTDRSR